MVPKGLPRISLSGAVDADGHILEPPDLWERYLELVYRERAVRIRKDDHGLEYLEVDGRPSKRVRKNFPAMLGIMDRLGGFEYARQPTGLAYVDSASFGAMDARERLDRLDHENLQRVFLYPTLGLLWEAETVDPELAIAYARAYNRWILDFCADSGGRLIPVAHVPFVSAELAVPELRRVARDGFRGFFAPPYTWSQKSHGHPDHHPLLAAAAELGLVFGIHPSFEPLWTVQTRFTDMTHGATAFFQNVTTGDGVRGAFTSLFQYGVFDLFPDLRVVVLEIGAGWIGYWLERLDAAFKSPLGKTVPLKRPPSEYFRRQCWISGDPDERSVAGVIPFVGEDRFFWASDFPHADHPPEYLPNLEKLAALLPGSARSKLLGENVLRCYGLA